MSEFILAWIGWIIEKSYMVAVIAFVALQFGWIKRNETVPSGNASGTPSESGKGGKPQMDLSGLMQGMLSQLGPVLNQMSGPGMSTPEIEQPEQIEDDLIIKPRTFE